MKLLCQSLSGKRYGRKFCFVGFKPRGSKKGREKTKTKAQTRQARFPSITRSAYYERISRYERISTSSSSSVLSTDSVSSDSDDSDDETNLPTTRERVTSRCTTSCQNVDEAPPVVVTSTDESDSDFSESDISSVASLWSNTDSSTTEEEREREFEFYSDPDSNRQSTDSTRMPVFTEFINSLDFQLAQLLPLPIQVLSESLLRNFSDEVGWGPCPSCIVDILIRRKISTHDIDDGTACAICCADFRLEEEVISLPCKHFYHTECICNWLKIRSTCPTCRFDVCSVSDLPETEV